MTLTLIILTITKRKTTFDASVAEDLGKHAGKMRRFSAVIMVNTYMWFNQTGFKPFLCNYIYMYYVYEAINLYVVDTSSKMNA